MCIFLLVHRDFTQNQQNCNMAVASVDNSTLFHLQELVKLSGVRTREAKIRILNDVNGIINPGRLVARGSLL